ncbi:hypothetical protein BH11PLA2_BH11PLA2_08100 [soil metagenome]
MNETILIVDDEESVRKTFEDWLRGSGWPVTVLAAADAEAALLLANAHSIDLAILDWNLGSGSDGLSLLEDLIEFHPDLIAIMVTGYAAQATPLQALRRGVRDYLDKNSDLTRENFLAAVRKQLDRILPAKRQRHLNASLLSFRESIAKAIPLVQGTAALNDPLPMPEAIRSLFRFVIRGTGAADGVLVVHRVQDGIETLLAFDANGTAIPLPAVSFGKTIAASVMSFQEPCVLTDFAADSAMTLLPFEKNRKSLLAVPLRVRSGSQVVLELFDKLLFTDTDKKLAALAGEIGVELLRQALAERQTHRMLFDALESALKASDAVTNMLEGSVPLMDNLRKGLDSGSHAVVEADLGLELVRAVRELAVAHGPSAVNHCVLMVQELKKLLDAVNG